MRRNRVAAKPRRVGAPARPLKDLPPIGKLLRGIRGELSVQAAAARLGRSKNWWHNREVGTNAVTVDDLQAIAKEFGVGGAWGATGVTLSG
jgi:hypothetical protein